MLTNNFKINDCDNCVYYKHNMNDYILIILYVSTHISFVSSDNVIKFTMNILKSRFDMKDMRLLYVILLVKIFRNHRSSDNQPHILTRSFKNLIWIILR